MVRSLQDEEARNQATGLTRTSFHEKPSVDSGFSWFVIEQILRSEPHDEAFFWATHQGAEIDLVLRRGDKLLGVECKRTDTPRLTRSIGIALEDLGLKQVAVVHPGGKRFPLSTHVEAVPLSVVGGDGSIFTTTPSS